MPEINNKTFLYLSQRKDSGKDKLEWSSHNPIVIPKVNIKPIPKKSFEALTNEARSLTVSSHHGANQIKKSGSLIRLINLEALYSDLSHF